MKKSKNVFRPKARIVHTVGKELIANPNVAVLELVKNSYDADATEIKIESRFIENQRTIVIEDDGHGMTLDDIESKWLVLATENKKRISTSPKGRKLLGDKGIGRYASALLGNKLSITSTTENEIVVLELDWNDFTQDKFLDEINIFINSRDNNTKNKTGTRIEILDQTPLELFNTIDEEKLKRDLSLLISTNKDFKILFNNFELISFAEQYPEIVEELYHYRMKGVISNDNEVSAELIIKENGIILEKKQYDSYDFTALKNYTKTGKIHFDIKVFNRDTWGKSDLRKIAETNNIDDIINNMYGVAIYRNGACLQPYGSTDFDWLLLDKARVQNPSVKLGNNQVYGIVTIESEEISNLIENSSREGLKQNKEYFDFVEKIRYIIQIIGQERATYRKGAPPKKMTDFERIALEIDTIFIKENFTNTNIADFLDAENVDKIEQQKYITAIQQPVIEKMVEAKNEFVKEIHNLELYALLGKLVARVSHELATPILNINTSCKILNDSINDENRETNVKVIKKLTISEKYLSNLKNMLKPLSESKKEIGDINFKLVINEILDTYKESSEYGNFIFNENISDEIKIMCFEADIYAILHNLIDNTSFWCKAIDVVPEVTIEAKETEDFIKITYLDNGPGVPEKIHKTMFEPSITLKPGGSGLGLTIITSLLNRIKGTIEFNPTLKGACFSITLPKREAK